MRFPVGVIRRLREPAQLPPVDEGFDDVLLDVQIVVVDRREGATQDRQVVDALPDAVVGDVVGRRLGARDQVIAHVLLDEAIAIMAADDRVREVHVLDFGLQLAAIELADLAAKDRGDLVGLADASIGIDEPLAEPVESGAAMEDEIVAELGLGEEESMLATGLLPLCCAKEWCKPGKPLLAAGDEVARHQLVGKLLQAFGFGASA